LNSFSKLDKRARLRRRKSRSPTLKPAELIVEGGEDPVIKCHLVEISESGARVVTQLNVTVPEFLLLRISDGVEYRCRRAWSKGKVVGFEFLREKRWETGLW